MDSAQGRVRKLVGILRSTSFLVQHHLEGQPLPELAELKKSLERAMAALQVHAAGSDGDHGAVHEFADQD